MTVVWLLVSRSLPSNGSTCQIVTSLRLYRVPPFLLLRGLWIWSLFFHFGGGRPLHAIQSYIFRSLTEDSTARFATSSPRVCLTVLLYALSLPRRSCFLGLGSLCRCCIPSLPSSLLDRRSFMTAARTPCRNGTAGTPFAAPYGQTPIPRSALICPHRFIARRSIRDFLMLRYGLYFWNCLPLLQTSLHHGLRPFLTGPHCISKDLNILVI
jgi:hypothetical protein